MARERAEAQRWPGQNQQRPFQLNIDEFLLCLREARRGAASGPPGMTSDHLFPILESEVDSGLFGQVGSLLRLGTFHRPFCRRSGWDERLL